MNIELKEPIKFEPLHIGDLVILYPSYRWYHPKGGWKIGYKNAPQNRFCIEILCSDYPNKDFPIQLYVEIIDIKKDNNISLGSSIKYKILSSKEYYQKIEISREA